MKLSERLQTIAEEIRPGETMADIGTDHGFLPIYLRNKGRCPKVILTDISQGSLDKALADCEAFGDDEFYDLRIGDGLTVLHSGEVDNVVIAGMGALLMTKILGEDLAHSKSFSRLILQPRNNVGYLRWWLAVNGFSIVKEHIVREGKFLPEILVAEPNPEGENSESMNLADSPRTYEEAAEQWDYPLSLVQDSCAYTGEYLSRELQKQKKILASIRRNAQTKKTQEQSIYRRVKRLEVLLQEVETDAEK